MYAATCYIRECDNGRLVFAEQLKEELRLGHLPPESAEVRESEFKPLHLEGFVSFDEKHLKQKVGVHTKTERRVKRKRSGEPSSSGELPPKKKKVPLKYEQEARGLFGCYVSRNENGQLIGKKLTFSTTRID